MTKLTQLAGRPWRAVPAPLRQALGETLLWWLALAAIIAYGWCWR